MNRSTAPESVRTEPGTVMRLVAAAVVINLFLAGLTGWWLYQSRQQYDERAEIVTRNLSKVLEENLAGLIQRVDLVLLAVVDEATREMARGGIDRPVFEEFMRRQESRLQEGFALVLINDRGGVEHAPTLMNKPGVNITDREHFIYLRDHPAAGLFISKPVIGRLSGRPVILLARRLSNPDGSFAGLAQMAIALDYFHTLFSALDVGPHGVISLRDREWGLISRTQKVGGEDITTGSKVMSPELVGQMKAGLTSGTFYSPIGPDNISRIISYSQILKTPMFIFVGAAIDDYLEEWYGEAVNLLLLLLVFALLTALSCWLEIRGWRHRIAAARREALQVAEYTASLERAKEEAEAAREALGVSQERLAFATEGAHIGIWDFHPITHIDVWDDQMRRLYGLAPGDTSPGFNGWRSFLHPDDRERAEQDVAAALAGERPFDSEFRIVRPDGTVRHTKSIGQVIRDAEGRPNRMLGISYDITERKRFEQDLKEARIAAEQASRAKSAFVANMSHEIRTPMNAILGLIYLLDQTRLTPVQRDYVGKTRLSAQSLLGILNDILDFSKVEADRLELELVPFRLDQLMNTLAAVTSANTCDKDIEVLFDLAPGTPLSLVGDSLRLQQVLMNLASNAIKFTPHGEVVLSVAPKRIEGDRVELVFAVRDTGIGIEANQCRNIFDAFSQADNSTTRRYGGSGLGLAICKRLVALMGGEITVESEPGRGSTFRFTGRFGHGPDLETTPVVLPERLRPLRLLLVDDNPTAREVLAAMIAPFGWDGVIADSGRQAIEAIDDSLAQGRPFDLLILDWHMPEIGGGDVLRHAKERCPPAALPVILVVTAFGQDRIRQETADDASVRVVLTKPVTPSALLDAVAAACSARSADAAGWTASALPAAPAPGSRRLDGASVLLVEDNAINQLVARRILEALGAVVEIAGDGLEAVNRLTVDPGRFGVVLMDIQMPGMDGLVATGIIRKTLGLSDLPVIAMTANALPSDRERCLAAGMTDHVSKPLDVEQLISVLDHYLRRPDPAEAVPPPEPAQPEPDLPVPDLPYIDRAIGLRRTGGDTALLKELMAIFLENHSDSVATVARAQASGNLPAISQFAHDLKALAGSIGAESLSVLAGRLQAAIRLQHPDQVAALAERLQHLLPGVLAAVREDVDAWPFGPRQGEKPFSPSLTLPRS